ncbi:TonB-dependent receptor [Parasphingorhabdus sp.]|uniref:TonB-dependent receptor n=1 Tax=Parasphingorhabdus sp. TaxID=2709688 RepID=UPI003267A837
MGASLRILKRQLAYGTALGLMGGVAAPALAQDQESSSKVSTGNAEIIVTARKKTERLQEAPVAVTAIGADRLDRIGATDISDLSGRAPNVTINTIGNFGSSVAVFIRGIGNGDPDSTVDPSVGIYVDGVYIPRTANSSLDLFDVEQVEILRGPQGTLFGRNTTGGAVNYRTKRPTGQFDIRGQVTLGDFGQRDIKFAAETPLIDDVLSVKVAAFSQHLDGYYLNTFTGIPGRRNPTSAGKSNTFTFRPSILFTPTDNFELTIIGEYSRERSENLPSINVTPPNKLLQIFYNVPSFARTDDVRAFAFNVPGQSDIDIWGVTVEANWEIGPGTLTSISNYRETTKDINNNDTDGTTAPFFETLRDQPHEQYSSELRYNANVTDDLNIIAGLYYFQQEYFLRRDTFLNVTNGPTTARNNAITGQTHKNFAVFAQAEYNITPELRVSLGGRYTKEKKDFFATFFTPFPNLGPITRLDDTWSNFGPSVGIDYQASDDVLLYAKYSKGFKSGGFNGRGGTPGALGPFDEESVNAFEGGVKADWFDNRLRTNVAVYYNKYTDLQRTVIRTLAGQIGGNNQETVTDNAASATVKGFELEVSAVPIDGLNLDFSAGYNNASYDEYLADLNGDTMITDNSDLEISRAPKWTLGGGISYAADLGGAGILTFRGDWTHVGKQNLLVTGALDGRIPAYDVIDASIRWDLPGDQAYVNIFVKNLNKELYEVSYTPVGTLFDFHNISPPRRWGITLGFDL